MNLKVKNIVFCLLFLLFIVTAKAQVVSTLAGFPYVIGSADGTGNAARFNSPHGIACDPLGTIYIADRFNHKIRKVTLAGVVTTLAGSGSVGSSDGTGSAASFNEPWAVACDTAGNIYVADTKNYKIRKITSSGIVTTIAGAGVFGTTNGPSTIARFGFSSGICVTPDGSTIYVADHNTHVIRKINGGIVSTLAGTVYIAGSDDGAGNIATFNHPYGIDLDNNGNIIVADEWNNIIRKVTLSGNVITLAGVGINGSTDGQASVAMFNYPWDVTVDSIGNVFVADGFNYNIRKIAATTWMVSTFAGTAGVQGNSDGIGPAASFDGATGIAYNRSDQCFYIADAYNHLIRKISDVSSIAINLITTASNNTVCFEDSITFQASPSGLINYIFKEGNNTLATSTNGNITLQPLSQGAHTITCTATDPNGATAFSNSLIVSVRAPFIPVVNPATISFCNGDSLLITAQSGINYLWSTGDTMQSIYVNSNANNSVTVTNVNGCKGVLTLIIPTVLNGPLANITPSGSLTICSSDSVQLSASNGSSLWLWSNGSSTQHIYAHQQGNYTVAITGANGCSSVSAPSTVSYFPGSVPTISPAGPITIIQGDTIVLNGSTGTSYQWTNGSTNQNISVSVSGNYSVIIISNNGCISQSNQVQVNVIAAQQLINALGVTSFCDGYSVVLSSYFFQGNQWHFNGTPIAGETNQQITATDSGYYSLAILQNGNWLYSDSILVEVNYSPQMPLASDTNVCSGIELLLQAQSVDGSSLQWYNQSSGGTLLANGNVLSTVLHQNAQFHIQSIATNGCVSIERTLLNVYVNPSPVIAFDYTIQSQGGNFTAVFNNKTQFADNYVWTFGDTLSIDNSSKQIHPSHIFSGAGEFEVTLISNNVNSCSDTLSQKIIINTKKDLFIPTTFTPNGDGHNDLFRVRGNNFELHELSIYNQWGFLVYQTNSSKPSWDGMQNGVCVENGTYMYRIHITVDNAETQVLTGGVTIIK